MEQMEPWQQRWQDEVTPWDLGKEHPLLKRILQTAQDEGGLSSGSSIVVPGCGKGHEAAYCERLGYTAIGLDFVPEAIEAAKSTYAESPKLSFEAADFFNWDAGEGCGAILDRAMLCALQEKNRSRYIDKVHSSLKSGGLFMGILFGELDESVEQGPPFRLTESDITAMFLGRFSLVSWETHSNHAKPSFIKNEFLCIWRKL